MKPTGIISSFLLLLLALSGSAQVTQRNILATTYSPEKVVASIIPKDQWKPYPLTPQQWKDAVPDSMLKGIVDGASSIMSYAFEPISGSVSMDFKRSGDRLRHSGISFKKREALMHMILAESIEDRGRFMEGIFNGIWSICEESYWGVPAHIGGTGLPDVENPVVDLFTAETAGVMAMADYFVGEKLDKINPLIRKRMYHETDRRLFTPMMKNGDKYGWMSRTKPVNNWNPWIMSNWILSTLMLERNEVRRVTMTHAAMKGLDAYLNSLGEDGGCDEGPSYWFAAGASVYDCLELLHNASAGKIDIYGNELIKKMAGYITSTHIAGNYFVNFADADPTLTPSGMLLYRFGKDVKDTAMIEFGKWAQQNYPFKASGSTGMRMRHLGSLLSLKQMDQTPSKFKDPANAWIGDVQILTARTEKGLFLATHGGHNAESHNHNDVGDFIIYVKGEPMIIDAGRGNYTARTFSSKRYELWFTQSQYHNLPIINGIGQLAGREFEAKSVKSLINEKESSLTMDIAGAYPEAAGIERWNRTVRLNRSKETVEINEDYQFKANPVSLQEVFMTVCAVDTTVAGKILFSDAKGNRLAMEYDAKKWTVTTEIPSFEGMEYESFDKKWGGKKITRVILNKQNLTGGKGTNTFLISVK